jgi:allantoicase
VILRLGGEGFMERIEVDTAHFKGNFPDACSLEVSANGEYGSWHEVLPQSELQADTRHFFHVEPAAAAPARFARFNIFPDGGVSRLRLFGRLSETGRMEARLAALNAAAADTAARDLLTCCGSQEWAARMTAARPFSGVAHFEQEAARIWTDCSREHWLEAFAAHPRIGESSGGPWSRHEQSGVQDAGAATLAALADANQQYEEKFGYPFIICATGKRAAEMLALLEARLGNDPHDEIRNAAAQQQLITSLRLKKLLSE